MYRMKSINNNSHRKRDIILTIIASLLFVVFCYMLDAASGSRRRLLPSARSSDYAFVYTILGLSMNLINGFTGQFSSGQPGVYGYRRVCHRAFGLISGAKSRLLLHYPDRSLAG